MPTFGSWPLSQTDIHPKKINAAISAVTPPADHPDCTHEGRDRVNPELVCDQQHVLSIYYLLDIFPEERASSRRPRVQFVWKDNFSRDDYVDAVGPLSPSGRRWRETISTCPRILL